MVHLWFSTSYHSYCSLFEHIDEVDSVGCRPIPNPTIPDLIRDAYTTFFLEQHVVMFIWCSPNDTKRSNTQSRNVVSDEYFHSAYLYILWYNLPYRWSNSHILFKSSRIHLIISETNTSLWLDQIFHRSFKMHQNSNWGGVGMGTIVPEKYMENKCKIKQINNKS